MLQRALLRERVCPLRWRVARDMRRKMPVHVRMKGNGGGAAITACRAPVKQIECTLQALLLKYCFIMYRKLHGDKDICSSNAFASSGPRQLEDRPTNPKPMLKQRSFVLHRKSPAARRKALRRRCFRAAPEPSESCI